MNKVHSLLLSIKYNSLEKKINKPDPQTEKPAKENTKANRAHEHVQEDRNKQLMRKGRLLKK